VSPPDKKLLPPPRGKVPGYPQRHVIEREPDLAAEQAERRRQEAEAQALAEAEAAAEAEALRRRLAAEAEAERRRRAIEPEPPEETVINIPKQDPLPKRSVFPDTWTPMGIGKGVAYVIGAIVLAASSPSIERLTHALVLQNEKLATLQSSVDTLTTKVTSLESRFDDRQKSVDAITIEQPVIKRQLFLVATGLAVLNGKAIGPGWPKPDLDDWDTSARAVKVTGGHYARGLAWELNPAAPPQ
jgi:hypothetical protein